MLFMLYILKINCGVQAELRDVHKLTTVYDVDGSDGWNH